MVVAESVVEGQSARSFCRAFRLLAPRLTSPSGSMIALQGTLALQPTLRSLARCRLPTLLLLAPAAALVPHRYPPMTPLLAPPSLSLVGLVGRLWMTGR